MLSYKEYKLLNESLYGAFNLGLKSHNTVGGIVSGSSVNGTEAALEAESEEAIEEAKKCKKMKKKMDSVEMIPDDEEMKKKKVPHDEHDEDENEEDDDHEDEDEDEDDDEDEDHDDEEDSDEDEEDENEEDHEEKSMKEKPMFMKKKAKKEWSEVVSDLETVLEEISDEDALQEIKKGLETIKEGMKKGMKKHMGCGSKKYMKDDKDHDDEDEGDNGDEGGLTDAQKKLPPALRKAILKKKGKKGKKKDKKCMTEEEASWWKSVNGMLGSDPNHKNWDGGWKEVGEVEQAVREGVEPKKIVNEISSDLLDRAAGIARDRGDSRGDRLAYKFANMSNVRLSQEIESSPFKIELNNDFYIIKSLKSAGHGEYALNLKGQGVWNQPPVLLLTKPSPKELYSLNIDSEVVYEVDRKTANTIANFINSNGGQIKPTDLPLK